MKSRRNLIVLALLVIVATVGWTQLRASARAWEPGDVELKLDVTVSADWLVEMGLVLTNNGEKDATFRFRSGQQHELVIQRKDAAGNWVKMWQWSDDMMFTEALTSITLASGEAETFTGTWTADQAGEYRVIGTVLDRNTTLETQTLFTIE
jgi:hypothetical protein